MDHRRLTAAVVVAATTMLFGPPAIAAGPFGSTTTLHAAISKNGRELVLTATVAGSFGSASGTVAFVDDHGAVLGAQPLPASCAARCAVTQRVKATALAREVSGVYADYSGDATLQRNHAYAPVLYLRCRNGPTCSSTIAGTQTSFGLTLSKGQSALVTLGARELPCSIGAGQVVSVATTGGKTAIHAVLKEGGDAGAAYLNTDGSTFDTYAGHSAYRCLVSKTRFTGFHPAGTSAFTRSKADFARYGPAPRATAGHYRHQYVGLLADCYYLVTHRHTATGACENIPKLVGPIPDQVDILISAGRRVSHLAG